MQDQEASLKYIVLFFAVRVIVLLVVVDCLVQGHLNFLSAVISGLGIVMFDFFLERFFDKKITSHGL